MINRTYKSLVSDVLHAGAMAFPRKMHIRELLFHNTEVPMSSPAITLSDRDLDYKFMAAEASWILKGSRRLDDGVHKNLVKYSDDGVHMSGAYGPLFVQQLRYVVSKLSDDPDSRQAVVTIWSPSPRDSKDIPCTVSLQFLVRNNVIHCYASMRSSDVWLGWPYDAFTFSMMTLYVALHLSSRPDLGRLHLCVGSQHIYERHFTKAESLLESNTRHGSNLCILTHMFNTPDDLIIRLDSLVNATDSLDYPKFKEILCPA
jgi:thymidylate synthase